jgi:ankyrin repeat protein
VLEALDKMSRGESGLEEAYDSAIERINGQLEEDRGLATRILSWITYAQRSLTTVELCHALAVEHGDPELDIHNIPDIEDVVSVCAGLVAIDEESNIIRLVHFTTQEYFEHIRATWNPGAQLDIALTCLTYLSFDAFRSGACSNDEDLDQRLHEYKLLEYTAQHWGHHVHPVQEEIGDAVALTFLKNEALIATATQSLIVTHFGSFQRSQRFAKHTTGLHLSSKFGLLHFVKLLIEQDNTTINAKDTEGRTSLSFAAASGHEVVVKLLLAQNGLEVNSVDAVGMTPLLHAAKADHEAVIKLLLARGDIDINTMDDSSNRLLNYLADNKNEDIIKLLLTRNDVDINIKDKYGGTALMYAVEDGSEAVVKLLMMRDDIKADTRDGRGRTPLWYAAARGRETIATLLITRNDVDVNTQDVYGDTVLMAAARTGEKPIVKILLARDDIDINATNTKGETAMSMAEENGQAAIVKLLDG